MPLHYGNPDNRRAVEACVARLGPDVKVTTPDGSWMVPRHFIALHGIKSVELPALAGLYGFRRVSSSPPSP